MATLLLASCGGGGGAAGSGGGEAASNEPINIGGGFALTGDESALDLPAANGAQLAAKEINAAGGVLGRQVGADLAELFRTADHREGVAAFLERREPRFAGR